MQASRPVLIWERILLLFLFAGAAALLVERNWLWRWDYLMYDAIVSLQRAAPPDDIVIIAIDEASLSALGRWPWPRRVHAKLLRRLQEAQPNAVALDIIFAEPDSRDPEGDQALAAAVRDSGRVVLPVLLEQPRVGGLLFEQLPMPLLVSAAANLGHVHVELDADGLARSVFLRAGLGDPRWPALPLALLQISAPGTVDELPGTRAPAVGETSPQQWMRDYHMLVPFVGPPGGIPRISYVQALRGEYSPQLFTGKYLLVGVTATGLGDSLPTPVSGLSQPMPGVEFSANALQALRTGTGIVALSRPWQMLITCLLVVTPLLLYPKLRPSGSFLTAVALIAGTAVLTLLSLFGLRVWFAPASALLLLLLSYPVWSWLRLEYAMRYLATETRRIKREQARTPVSPAPAFADAMQFIAQALPLRGWILTDCDGRRHEQFGEIPEVAVAPLQPGVWRQENDTLFAGFTAFDHDWQVAARWGGTQAPEPAERRLLAEVVGTVMNADELAPQDSIEVVQTQIAELQQANAALSALRRMIDDGLAHMADGVLVISVLGQVLLANRQAANLLGRTSPEQLQGRAVLDLLAGLEWDGELSWRRVLVDKDPLSVNARTAHGKDLLLQLSPLRGDIQSLGALIINIADISELKQSERNRAEVLSFLSHDLRAPLVSVLATLEVARSQQGSEALARIESYTRTTLALAEQFVELTRAETQAELSNDEFDLIAVALNAAEQVWDQAHVKNITVTQVLDAEEAWIHGDPSLIERALVNLLSNAVKYSPPGATVRLEISRQTGMWRCCVIDTGHGIAADQLPHLFQRFKRVQRDEHARESGIGLGLAFVKVVAERHGGGIDMRSEVGVGSTFCLQLPAG
ncbi:MAG: CHASE2 domain-containing protein [Gammaproteobacteria bacterium]|nr:CHASE2 domain-containing protein [Gammaproteobacteria bacterium]